MVLATNQLICDRVLVWYLLTCFLLFSYCALGQAKQDTVGENIRRLYQEAESLFNSDYPTKESDQKAVKLYLATAAKCQDTSAWLLKANCYRKVGIIYFEDGRSQNALDFLRRAITTRQIVSTDSANFEDYLYTGDIYYLRSAIDSALHFYQRAEGLAMTYSGIKKKDKLYNSMGSYYFSLGNYRQAKNYLYKSLQLAKRREKKDIAEEGIIKNNIAIADEKLGNYDEAIVAFKALMKNSLHTQAILHNLGLSYGGKQQYDSAVYYLRRALLYPDDRTKNITLNYLGHAYTRLGKLDSALHYYASSLTLNSSLFSNKNVILANAYRGVGDVKAAQLSFDSALHYYQKSLSAQTFSFNSQDIYSNPTDFADAISLPYLFETLRQKASTFGKMYAQRNTLIALNHSLATYQLAIRVAQHIQKTYDNDEAKLFLVDKVAPVYEEAIATAVQLHQLTDDPRYVAQAFQFSEASKAAVLTESLRDVKIKSSGQVNDSLVQEEHRIKQQITALRLKLVESQDSAQNERYRQQLIDQEIALARTIKHLQKDEHYYQRKYQPDSLDIAALQRSLLGGGETLLEYFVGQQKIYVFALRRDDLQIASVARTAELDSALQRTQRQLYDYRPGQGDDEASLATLYRYLITPVADAIADARKLIIVPDGPLHYLPFDLLSADGQRANYLIHTHTLHYGYSASLLQQAIDERRGYPTEAVLAMAPFAGGEAGGVRSQGFSRLRDSQTEVESVGGSIYTEGRATKRRFLRVAGSYNVLHLATHATVDAENPSQSFIAFYPQQRDSVANYRLYTHELYNMRLDSVKLVILSACEAGNGQLVRGEGVMSLARAFAYAGCPNIITTLWKADDRSSARLTTRLHHYLKRGWEKDEALRQAKLDYLNDPEVHPAQKTPYYWANFVFIGDPAPIYDNYRWWWLAVGLLLIVLVGGLLRWRQEQRRAKQTA